MEDNNNKKMKKNSQEEEKEETAMIPVLTVFKKNAIIRNILIIFDHNNKNDDQILVVGRDTNCRIVLTHPSISRSHLNIRFSPSSRSLSIEDLSSVHGTWVCGKKIEPGVRVELKEHDTIKIGLSSRVYLLRFVKDVDSLSCDKTLHHLLAPPSVHSVDDTETLDTEAIEDCSQEDIPGGETNLLCTLKEYFTQNICMPVVEAVQATKLNQLQGPPTFTAQQPQPSSVEDFWFTSPTPPTDPESFTDKIAASEAVTPRESEFEDGSEVKDVLTSGARASVDSHSFSDGEKQGERCQEDDSKLHSLNAESCNDEKGYSIDELAEDIGEKGIENIALESLDENEVAVTVIPKECKFECTILDYDKIEDSLTTETRIFSSEENTTSPKEDAIPTTEFLQINIVREVAVGSLSDGEEQNKCDWELNSYLTPKSCDKGYSLEKIIEDRFHIESSLNPSIPEVAYLRRDEERQTPQSVAGWFDVEILETCLEEEATGRISNSTFDSNIWPKSGMSASAHQDQTRKSKFINTSSVDSKDEMSNLKGANITNRPKDLFSVLDEEVTFTPKDLFSVMDEEKMFTPKKQSKQPSMSQKLHNLKANFSPSIYLDERSTSASSNKENKTPKSAQEWKREPLECQDIMELKKKKEERIPLQSLINSEGNHKSGNSSPSSAAKTVGGEATAKARICGQISNKLTKPCHNISEGKRSWEMVVDAGSSPFSAGGICESGDSSPFSAAKTLDGATAGVSNCGQISIKNTIPSHISEEGKRSWDMVVVDTASLLDKESRKALQLLQGLKGTRLIIPESVIRELGSMKQQYRFFRRTSEADLTLQWIKECLENTKWWIHIQSSMVIEDDILDYALQYRRKENAGQIVLLSNDVTLKIKSMAKGLLCETVQQFRKSLVNPFSDRFRWAKSAPRGLTWSCHNDVVLWEKYSGLPSKAGLKLINTTLAMMTWC